MTFFLRGSPPSRSHTKPQLILPLKKPHWLLASLCEGHHPRAPTLNHRLSCLLKSLITHLCRVCSPRARCTPFRLLKMSCRSTRSSCLRHYRTPLSFSLCGAACQTGIIRTSLGAILFGTFAQPNLANIYTIAYAALRGPRSKIIRKSLTLRCEQFRANRFLAEQGSRRS